MGILDEIDGFSNEIYKKFPKFEHFLPNFIQIFENLCPVLIFFLFLVVETRNSMKMNRCFSAI